MPPLQCRCHHDRKSSLSLLEDSRYHSSGLFPCCLSPAVYHGSRTLSLSGPDNVRPWTRDGKGTDNDEATTKDRGSQPCQSRRNQQRNQRNRKEPTGNRRKPLVKEGNQRNRKETTRRKGTTGLPPFTLAPQLFSCRCTVTRSIAQSMHSIAQPRAAECTVAETSKLPGNTV